MAKIKLALALALAVGLASLTGCSSTTPPTAFERHFFTITTNFVPVVTNWVESVTVTNQAAHTVTMTNEVFWRTNIFVETTYTANTNAAALVGSVDAITGILAPGWGQLAGVGLSGLLGLWGLSRSRKAAQMTTGAAVLSQSIETLLNIIGTTPQGQQLTDKLKVELAKNQNAAGVLAEIANLVATQVDNDAAKKAAQAILASLPQSPP